MNGRVVHCQRETYDIYIGRGMTRARDGRASGVTPTRTGPAASPA
jgi:hypothetical protein